MACGSGLELNRKMCPVPVPQLICFENCIRCTWETWTKFSARKNRGIAEVTENDTNTLPMRWHTQSKNWWWQMKWNDEKFGHTKSHRNSFHFFRECSKLRNWQNDFRIAKTNVCGSHLVWFGIKSVASLHSIGANYFHFKAMIPMRPKETTYIQRRGDRAGHSYSINFFWKRKKW